jgi:hypothetical protein
MGINVASGRMASVTNIRSTVEMGTPDPVSRGVLLTSLLHESPWESKSVPSEVELPGEMDGFNVVLYDPQTDALTHLTNRQRTTVGPHPIRVKIDVPRGGEGGFVANVTEMDDSVHCVSNGGLDEKAWPKVKFLLEEGSRAMDAATASASSSSSSDSELEELARIVRTAHPLMHTVRVIPPDDEASITATDLDWSPAPRDVELLLQRGVMIPGQPGYPAYLVTRAFTIAAFTEKNAYYCFKTLDSLQREAAGDASVGGVSTPHVPADVAEDISGAFAAAMGSEWPPEAAVPLERAGLGGTDEVLSDPSEAEGRTPSDVSELLRRVWSTPWSAWRIPLHK